MLGVQDGTEKESHDGHAKADQGLEEGESIFDSNRTPPPSPPFLSLVTQMYRPPTNKMEIGRKAKLDQVAQIKGSIARRCLVRYMYIYAFPGKNSSTSFVPRLPKAEGETSFTLRDLISAGRSLP